MLNLSIAAQPSNPACDFKNVCLRMLRQPAISALAVNGNPDVLRQLYLDATHWLTYLNFAVLGLIALVGEDFLRRWVGPEFVKDGYPILLLITFTLLIDSLTQIPSLINDGLGHPKVTNNLSATYSIY